MKIHQEFFADDGTFPNSRLPLLVYPGAVAEPSAEAMEGLFAQHGWPPAWRASVFTYHHYHSRSHEGLGVASGSARLQFGGPQGTAINVTAGDVVVIPAGVAHKRLASSPDFQVVGCYPPDQQDWDLLKGEANDRPQADRNIAMVSQPQSDPVLGPDQGLVTLWAPD